MATRRTKASQPAEPAAAAQTPATPEVPEIQAAAPKAKPRTRPKSAARPKPAPKTDAQAETRTAKPEAKNPEPEDLATQASRNTLAINPIIGIRGADVAGAAASLLKVVARSPVQAGRHYVGYLQAMTDVLRGKSEQAPDPKDRRFTDPAWQANGLYRRLMQSYLTTQSELNEYIDAASADGREKGRAKFFTSLVTDALAPSNWLLGNPTAVRKTLDTGGDNLVKGLRNLRHDIKHNHMMPSQVDATPFKVGENIATSAGQVVFRHDMFELLQYTPTTAQVHARPLIISPPQVNKFYAIDLTPDKSLVKWATDSGVQLFVVSWRNPTVEHRDWGLDHYVAALDRAVDVTREITGSPDVNMWGSCSGGMTLAAYLGWLAAQGDTKVANTTWAVCVLNSAAALDDSTLGLFNSPATIRTAKARSRRKGFVDGHEMASMFAWLRPNDLIWNYWVNNYLLGNSPPAYDVLAWNADTTRLPGQYHCDLLDMVEKNPYINPGSLEIGGRKIDMRQVKVGAYVIAGLTDHITPWRACYGTARLFGPQTTYVLSNAGHIQSMINPPGVSRSYYFSGTATAESPDQWAEQARPTRQEGSWWPHWRTWIQQRSGEMRPAPTTLGATRFPPLGPAPGTYVMEK